MHVIVGVLLLVLFVALIVLLVMAGKTLFSGLVTRAYTGGGGVPRIFTDDPWFTEIAEGRKKVEARVGDENKYKDLIGKKIKIVAPGKKVTAVLKAVRHYKTLDAFLKAEKWSAVAPHTKSEKAARDAYMEIKNKAGESVYDDSRVAEKGGVVALEFSLA